jgi:hypothetical protein
MIGNNLNRLPDSLDSSILKPVVLTDLEEVYNAETDGRRYKRETFWKIGGLIDEDPLIRYLRKQELAKERAPSQAIITKQGEAIRTILGSSLESEVYQSLAPNFKEYIFDIWKREGSISRKGIDTICYTPEDITNKLLESEVEMVVESGIYSNPVSLERFTKNRGMDSKNRFDALLDYIATNYGVTEEGFQKVSKSAAKSFDYMIDKGFTPVEKETLYNLDEDNMMELWSHWKNIHRLSQGKKTKLSKENSELYENLGILETETGKPIEFNAGNSLRIVDKLIQHYS